MSVASVLTVYAPTFTLFFFFFIDFNKNWWDCGEFSIGFVKISSRECNAWRGLEPWLKSNFRFFFRVLKSVFFHFGLSSGCYCTMISPATVSAHRLRFLYDGVEKAGGMINGQENHRLNAFCHSHVLFSHHTCLFSCEFNRYYLALSFYKGGLAQKFLMDAKKME